MEKNLPDELLRNIPIKHDLVLRHFVRKRDSLEDSEDVFRQNLCHPMVILPIYFYTKDDGFYDRSISKASAHFAFRMAMKNTQVYWWELSKEIFEDVAFLEVIEWMGEWYLKRYERTFKQT